MICSSVNLDRFIVRPLQGDGLYPFLEEFAGLRSPPYQVGGQYSLANGYSAREFPCRRFHLHCIGHD
jgi:hypothetical protein